MKRRLDKKQREAIGSRLKEVRLFNKLEQTELANRAGLSQAIISQYEHGLTEVPLSFIKFLVKTFGVSGDWVIFGTSGSPSERGQKEIEVSLLSPQMRKTSKRKPSSEFLGVPLVSPKAAAGSGKIQVGRVSQVEIVRLPEFVNRENLVALDLQASWVKNMNPPFQEGSRVIIDRDDKKIQPGVYYALNTQMAKKSPKDARVTAIRRLNLSRSRLWFIEDPLAREFEYIDLKSSNRLEEIIVGRVIWIRQKLL